MIVAIIPSITVLASCAARLPAYQPQSMSNAAIGYAEERLQDGRLRVTYLGRARTRVSDLDRLALRRAAELTIHAGYGWFNVVDRVVNRDIYVLSSKDGTRVATYRGGYKDWRRYWRLQCLARQWGDCDQDLLWLSPSRPRGSARIELVLTIELVGAPPPHHREQIDARSLIVGVRASNPH